MAPSAGNSREMGPTGSANEPPRRVVNPLPQLIPQRLRQVRGAVAALVWERSDPLPVQAGPLSDGPVPLAAAQGQPLRPLIPGEIIGPRDGFQQRWFRVEIAAAGPDELGRRHLLWQSDGESTAWWQERPWAGLDAAHPTCPLPDEAGSLWLDCGLWESVGGRPRRRVGPHGLRFDQCRLLLRDELAWSTMHDLDVFEELRALLYQQEGLAPPRGGAYNPPLESCSPLLRLLLRELDDAFDVWVRQGLVGLAEELSLLGARLQAEAWQPVAALTGHAHIDLVWLWPEAATDHKVVHSFANVLRLMERYPELTFTGSQPALYRKVERLAPTQLAEIETRIAEGRWELAGGFETEPDTNLPSGEGLVRSLVYGQRRTAEMAGSPTDICWLPDTFGYSASLPQILALSGIQSFFTTKLTWSQITRFPYTSFVWRGSDGSEVLAHVCPINYNGSVRVRELVEAARADQQIDVFPAVLLPTGWGDGGGGPTEAMCERARRLADLAGVPRARWQTPQSFFAELQAARERLPVYQGELYLEYHRGTLTTQSEYKRLYRAAELALQAHEAARVVTCGPPLPDDAWLRLLYGQFHDALPGSSIGRVYAELNPELAGIAERESSLARDELASGAAGLIIFNPLPLPRTLVLDAPDPNGESRPVLIRTRPLERATLTTDVLGYAPVREATPGVLDNGIVRATFHPSGQLNGLSVDGEPLQLSAPAGLVLYDDNPADFDAWDIDHYSFKTGVPVADHLKLELIESGPLRAVLRGSAPLGGQSSLSVSYILEAESRWLRLELDVDWHEAHRLLRLRVPTAYRGRFARFGSPFGSVLRSQWPGGLAEEAMWEVAGSRWAAVTRDDGAGLALLAEAKFGFSCRDGDLGVSLLRGPRSPDPEADLGRHHIRLALGRHEPVSRGDVLASAAAADALFAPLLLIPGAELSTGPFELESLGSLVPSWVLPAVDGGFILRMHETGGSAGEALLRLRGRSIPRLVDLREQPIAELETTNEGAWRVPYGPYQIVSVAVR